jgi:hypothetical protein
VARDEVLLIRHYFLEVGQLAQCQPVLEDFLIVDEGDMAKIASAPVEPLEAESWTESKSASPNCH